MSILFSPGSIKNIEVKNRFVRSATYEGMGSHEWRPSEKLAVLYERLADSNIGLIITGGVLVKRFSNLRKNPQGSYPLAIDNDDLCNDWRPITERVHGRGSKIVMQLCYLDLWENPPLSSDTSALQTATKERTGKIMPADLTADEIQNIIHEFAEACHRAKKAGFDGAQLHGGHGFLISRFISPYLNRRDDQYGGTTENRARFVVEIVEKARALVGDDYPLLVKMNCDDFFPGGLIVEEAARIARKIVKAGIDCIEVTGGISESKPFIRNLDRLMALPSKKGKREAYFRGMGFAIKESVDVPVILVGGMRTPAIMEHLIAEGAADFVSLSRPFIREPDLVARWESGDLSPAACISCNQCFHNVFIRPLRCYEKMGAHKIGP